MRFARHLMLTCLGALGMLAALISAATAGSSGGQIGVAWPLTVSTGLGAISHIVGPTDQPLQLATQSNLNINLSPNGTGLVVVSTDLRNTPSVLTAGTMTVTNSAINRKVWHRFDWTNAMVVALGGGGAGDIAVCTLTSKTAVTNAYVVIDTPDTSANALTVAFGRTGAGYIDYIVASDAKAAANTVYGDASAERGTNLVMYDLPSITGTTVLNAHFIKTTTALNTVTGSTGHIYLETVTLP